MKIQKTISVFTLLVSMFLINHPASAAEQLTGDEIARRINARDEGESVSRKLVMEMIDRRGKRRERITLGFRKYFGDEKRTVIFYQSPKNVKGTGFLTYDYPNPKLDDDQWLYLPAMRKVRRISASDRGDAFLGTDFSYEDIKKESKVSLEDYQYTTIGEEKIDGHHTIIVEQIPINKNVAKELGYSRVVSWVDSEIWMTRKSEFWDVRGNRLKTIYTREIRQVQGIWTAHRLEVINHLTGHLTNFTFSEVDYKSGVEDDIFTKVILKRGPQ